MEDLVEQETADPVPLVGMPADIPVVERQLTRSMTKATPEDMQRLEKDSDDEQEIPELVKDSDDDEELLKASPDKEEQPDGMKGKVAFGPALPCRTDMMRWAMGT